MAILQAYQTDLLNDLDKGQGLSPDEVAELSRTTDLALHATKQTATATGRSMVAMVVTERHLWVNLADIRPSLGSTWELEPSLCYTWGLEGGGSKTGKQNGEKGRRLLSVWEECCVVFREELRQVLGGQEVLPDDWTTIAKVIRETGRKVLGVSSGRRKEDKETWWWNEEVQERIQRKRLARKKWDSEKTEKSRQEYREMQREVKIEVAKAKQKAYEDLYARLDSKEGERDLYRLARQRDRDGKDVQQVRVIKDRDGNVLTGDRRVRERWKEYFEELMNEENDRERRVVEANIVEQEVERITKGEVRRALKRMKRGKAVGPDDIPVEVWKCLGEMAVEFLTRLFNEVLESERMPEEWRRSVLEVWSGREVC
ncbi:uncharacterized protein [Sinocyclocheilus grahami]|uniref:uncharacterized protein n=1 Tax=Sinocyclocheilus grahami TaxID=75366 RepID=UPI0007ACF548|nr:PREDICTED: uncharacterized protein LOC107565898 [Sinocyclocheilus grahami]